MEATKKNILAAMQEHAQLHRVPIMQPEGAAFLVALAEKHKPTAILEVGTAIGYSTLLLAMHSSAQITTLELDEQRAATARHYWQEAGVADRIELKVGDAAALLQALDHRYDFVFIDAAKGQYLDYLQKIVPHLQAGAVIIADNVLFRGLVLSEEPVPRRYRTIVKRLRAYLDFVLHDERFTTTVQHEGDGVAISYYRGTNE